MRTIRSTRQLLRNSSLIWKPKTSSKGLAVSLLQHLYILNGNFITISKMYVSKQYMLQNFTKNKSINVIKVKTRENGEK